MRFRNGLGEPLGVSVPLHASDALCRNVPVTGSRKRVKGRQHFCCAQRDAAGGHSVCNGQQERWREQERARQRILRRVSQLFAVRDALTAALSVSRRIAVLKSLPVCKRR